MDARYMRWDNRSPEQWLQEAGRFERMAERFDQNPELNASFAALARDARTRAIDRPGCGRQALEEFDWSRIRRTAVKPGDARELDYYRMRASSERAAASDARDVRVRRVHLELAERYEALIRVEVGPQPSLRLVS